MTQGRTRSRRIKDNDKNLLLGSFTGTCYLCGKSDTEQVNAPNVIKDKKIQERPISNESVVSAGKIVIN
jgi:hypothetical protein